MFGIRGRPSQIAPQPSIAVTGFSAQSLAGALVVSRTQSGPTCQMLGRGELIHVDADFRNQVGSGLRCDPDVSSPAHASGLSVPESGVWGTKLPLNDPCCNRSAIQ